MPMYRQTWLRTVTALLLVAAGVYASVTAGFFGQEILQEILILCLVVIALDLVAGFGGMVSLCHGALAGVGAYAFAGLAVQAGWPAPVSILGAVVMAGLAAAAIGAVTARAHGIFLIMATLAFGQMAYTFVFKSELFNRDDGLPGVPRLDLTSAGIDLFDGTHFSLLILSACVICYALVAWLLSSGFGRTVVAIHANEGRMRALGLPVWQYKAAVFGVSGLICGLAGAFQAQKTMFVNPEVMSWTLSGELLIFVILGGMGTLVGPILGTAAVVLLKYELKEITPYWHLIIGVLLVVAVFAGGKGVFGGLEDALRWLRRTLLPPHASAPRPAEDRAEAPAAASARPQITKEPADA